MGYNKEVWKEMGDLVKKLQMPEDYVSVHIRGGDKIQETDELVTVEECLKKMDMVDMGETKNVFVFTDDFRNVEEMEKFRPDWIFFINR